MSQPHPPQVPELLACAPMPPNVCPFKSVLAFVHPILYLLYFPLPLASLGGRFLQPFWTPHLLSCFTQASSYRQFLPVTFVLLEQPKSLKHVPLNIRPVHPLVSRTWALLCWEALQICFVVFGVCECMYVFMCLHIFMCPESMPGA